MAQPSSHGEDSAVSSMSHVIADVASFGDHRKRLLTPKLTLR